MKSIRRNDAMPQELVVAIGLVWGHLNVRQFDEAYTLVQGCLKLWPNDPNLLLLASYAAVETGNPLDKPVAALLKKKENQSWTARVLRRIRKTLSPGENA
jgi:hypothetical protein